MSRKTWRSRLRPVAAAGVASLVAGAALLTGVSSAHPPARASSALSGVATTEHESLGCATVGGKLTVLQENEFEHLDPGDSYYSVDYSVVDATQRPLYSDLPDASALPATPDAAEGQPEISDGGRKVTVHIKHGIFFSPPVNSEVTSEDVAYAIERGANPHVSNPYFLAYFDSVEGAPEATGGPIRGISTPNSYTIVFKLSRPLGRLVADALVLPLSAPVPKAYAEKLDRHKPSEYEAYEVATGPYMLKNNAEGRVLGIGFKPETEAILVRNPNWNPSTDFRPACLNEIDIKIGGFGGVLAKKTLEGADVVDSEGTTNPVREYALKTRRSQVEFSRGAGEHYIALNNKVGPFRHELLRKALFAALDRAKLNTAAYGNRFDTTATHFIYPGIPGFRQAGGYRGPRGRRFAFDHHPRGDLRLARAYMRRAGYPSGRYTGRSVVSIVASTGVGAERAELVARTLKELGFKARLKLVETAVMYAEYCNVPREEVTICPSVGWIADFGDPQTVLNITFNGNYINETGNVNWSQVNIPWLNAKMEVAERLQDEGARADAWARIDDDLVQHAVAIPVDWDNELWLEGTNVHGVGDLWNVGEWDYSFTSLR